MDALLQSLEAAVEASPEDVVLRIHFAELLIAAGDGEAAVRHLGQVLALDPSSSQALELLARATASSHAPVAPDHDVLEQLERELEGIVPPMFIDNARPDAGTEDAWADTSERVTLADVGGLADVKERLEAAFLAPLRNPELRRMYRKSLRGGLLLYGPPGCGKGFIARALAGELDATFLNVSINDVLDMYLGRSEQNLHEIFVAARRRAPTVIFFDELDALGRKRTQLASDAMRTTVNQLLSELDGMESANENVFVLGATNHPWDIDVALRRPGRFDRTVLVLPPDATAREVIFRTHLRDRPIASIDVQRLAALSEGLSGADIAHVCETAAEKAMVDAMRGSELRMIEMRDLEAALREIRPSLGSWFETARNVVTFAGRDGSYDELRDYMKKEGLL
jgi:SpoVK/Ycf46/Vps4 family AAA+-type ATPase